MVVEVGAIWLPGRVAESEPAEEAWVALAVMAWAVEDKPQAVVVEGQGMDRPSRSYSSLPP